MDKRSPQRLAVEIILQGGYMIDNTGYGIGYRVYDEKANVLLKLNERSYKKVSELLRKEKKHSLKLVLDKNKIRQLRRNSWIKQRYYFYQRQAILKTKQDDKDHKTKDAAAPLRCAECCTAAVHPTFCFEQQQ